MATTYLTRTFSTPTSDKIFTLSTWLKKSDLGNTIMILSAGSDGSNECNLRFVTDQLQFAQDVGGSAEFNISTTAVFRDVSAWYHVVLSVDTSQATSSDRVKMYVNGVQQAVGGTYPSQNIDTLINASASHSIGKRNYDSAQYFDGYMSEVIFVDGTALDPTSFGQFNANGIWTPIPIGISSYGTNGFRLKFENSASLGLDSSPNGNNFTVNNLTSVDQSTDTSTNNFCTANPLSKSSSITTANGNLSITMPSSTFQSAMATIAVDQGKWYWEQKVSSLGIINCGVTKSKQDGTTHSSVDAGRVMYSSNGNIYDEGFANSPIATGTTFTTNDIIGIALNLDAGTIGFYKNGSLIYTYSNAGLTTNEMTPAWGLYSATWDLNFGSPPFTISSGNSDADGYGNFEYAVPSGYYALCTKNLAEYG